MNDPVIYCDEIVVAKSVKDDGVILEFKYPTDNTGRVRETYTRIYLPRPVFEELKKTG